MLVQASFPNPEGLIRTGQFGRIKALMYVVEDGIMVPQRCITELQGMHRIHVVDENNVVEIREVKTGPTIHDFWYILEGLSAGEKVVYEGLQLVRPGMTVNPIVKDIQPTIPEKQ